MTINTNQLLLTHKPLLRQNWSFKVEEFLENLTNFDWHGLQCGTIGDNQLKHLKHRNKRAGRGAGPQMRGCAETSTYKTLSFVELKARKQQGLRCLNLSYILFYWKIHIFCVCL